MEIIHLTKTNEASAIQAEVEYITAKYGERNVDWKKLNQQLLVEKMTSGRDQWIDRISIRLSSMTVVEIQFDISEFMIE